MENSRARSFNDAKHLGGEWNTTVLSSRSRWLRWGADFLSQKRKGVDDLCAMTPSTGMVLDAGAGQGAYSIWFALRNRCTVVCVDISFSALRRIAPPQRCAGTIVAVCADLHALPFREERFCAAFSVDALGHVADVDTVLDELLRCVVKGAPLFLHSECADYKTRWPDRMLIGRLGRDQLAQKDGHVGLHSSRDLFMRYSRRFTILYFVNPAGYLGWCIGYPEKYRLAFAAAGMHPIVFMLSVFAAIKRTPVLGTVMRLANAASNHCENFFGLTGGGSCFSFVRKPT